MEYRTALVTGASSGLGRGLSLWLARRGIKVYAAARRTEQLEACAEEARSGGGGEVLPVTLDVSRTEDTLARIRQLDAECGGLDLVIANAGVGGSHPGHEARLEHGAAHHRRERHRRRGHAVRGAAEDGRARGRGHLVGVCILAAYRGLPRLAAYCGSKAFLATFLREPARGPAGHGRAGDQPAPGLREERDDGARTATRCPSCWRRPTRRGAHGPRPSCAAEAEYAFPWQMRRLPAGGEGLPNGLFDRSGRRVKAPTRRLLMMSAGSTWPLRPCLLGGLGALLEPHVRRAAWCRSAAIFPVFLSMRTLHQVERRGGQNSGCGRPSERALHVREPDGQRARGRRSRSVPSGCGFRS